MFGYAIENEVTYTEFCPGELAGLDVAERQARQQSYCGYEGRRPARLLQRPPFEMNPARDEYPSYWYMNTCKVQPGASLEECLAGFTVDKIKHVARAVNIRVTSSMRKAQLVTYVAEQLPAQTEAYRNLLLCNSEEVVCIIGRIAKGDIIPEADIPALRERLWAFPFVFLCGYGDEPSWYMPMELQNAFAGIDITSDMRRISLQDEIARLMFNFSTLCGVASASEVYDAFSLLYPNEYADEEAFVSEMRRIEEALNWPIALWKVEETTFVVHKSVNGSTPGRRDPYQRGYYDTYDEYGVGCEYGRGTSDRAPYTTEQVNTWTELVGQHQQLMSKATTDAVLQEEVGDFIYGLPCVRALTAYFDAHVPAGKDPYLFADEMVDDLIRDILFKRTTLADEIKLLTKRGWYLSECARSAPQLTLLVTRLYREIPRWELNGWSEIEFEDMQRIPHLISDSEFADADTYEEVAFDKAS